MFSRSCHWQLSTSQITSEYYEGYGWGEVVADGYGIAYMIKDNSFHFNVCSLFLRNHHFEAYFHEALQEMRMVFEASIPHQKAKL
jgi:carnitine O-acetyltransferase